ncbi:MAG TPA: hypothetical protein VH092_06610 [Urbifossiella sp.]|nr:hypothetical protein [Urbifossiella sp.]
MEPSIFLAFNLPNAATWFYFSLLLTVAVFFHFSRPLSTRNLDLLTLFLLVPGFLLLQEVQFLHTQAAAAEPVAAASLAEAAGWCGAVAVSALPETVEAVCRAAEDRAVVESLRTRAGREQTLAYVWLLAGSAYWFVRSLVDLALVRRPVASPNLTTAGMTWLGIMLFACMVAVAVQRTGEPAVRLPVGTRPIPISQFQDGAVAVVSHTNTGPGRLSPADVRFWVDRGLALACHLAVVIGLVMIGLRHFQDSATGVGLGTLYLLVPYTAFHVAQFHLVWPAAFVTWAVFSYRRPAVAGWLLGLAAGSTFVPLLLFPLWAGFYARRGLGRFTAWFFAALGLSLGITAAVLWWDGWPATGLSWAGISDWLPWRRATNESLWTGVHGAYRLPLFVLYVGFLAAVTIWPSPKTLSHLVALSAAVLIGVQFWHADRGGVYVLWYLPLILLMIFRPNLTGLTPPVAEPGRGLFGWAGAAWRRVRPGRATGTPNELAV